MGKFQNLVPGINHVGAFQVSGKPFASGPGSNYISRCYILVVRYK